MLNTTMKDEHESCNDISIFPQIIVADHVIM